MRETALEILNRVLSDKSYVNPLLKQVLDQSDLIKSDKALLTEIVYGTLRNLKSLDWIISQFSSRNIKDIPLELINALRIGAYQIIYLDKVPDHAACNETVELVKKLINQKIANFANGVLRNLCRNKEEITWPEREDNPVKYLSVVFSHPEWLVRMWVDDFGFDETERLLKADNLRPVINLRVNTLKVEVDDFLKLLKKDKIDAKKGKYTEEIVVIEEGIEIAKIPGFDEGLFIVQDESSCLAGIAVAPDTDDSVIDACAAPGGKTTHLSQLMKNQGKITAIDISKERLRLVEDNCRRLGIENVTLVEADSSLLDGAMNEPVDKILIDAPCSGLGTLKKRPDLRWQKSEKSITEMAGLQLKMLNSLSKLVKPGGVLVYSVCTISKPETAGVIEKFLAQNDSFKPDALEDQLPVGLRKDIQHGTIQLLPHIHLTDGMFIARLVRK